MVATAVEEEIDMLDAAGAGHGVGTIDWDIRGKNAICGRNGGGDGGGEDGAVK